MPISDLKADVKANLAELVALAKSHHDTVVEDQDEDQDASVPIVQSPGEQAIVAHLQNTLWPFLEAIIDQLEPVEGAIEAVAEELEEVGEAIDELTEGRGTVLMPAEAGVFANMILMTRELIKKLHAGQTPSADVLTGLAQLMDVGEKIITQYTINVDTEGDDVDDEEDDDDDE